MRFHWLIGAAASAVGFADASAAQSAQPALSSTAAPAHAHARKAHVSDAARVRELERRLDERDALVRDLQARVERLERGQPGQATAAAGPAKAAPRMAQVAAPPAPGNAPAPAIAQVSPAAPQAQAQAQAQPKAGPGQFTVSEEAAQHALERALVQSGAALLPRGKFEFVPSVTYQFQRTSTPGQLVLTTDQRVLITENVLRSTQVQATALFRVGLPWNTQLEFGAPIDYKDNTLISRVGGSGLTETGPSVFGVGDPSVALIKQILVEGDVRPGLFANVGWNPNLGQVKEALPLGKGFNQFSAGLTAVKRQDPLVFTGGFNYLRSTENNGLRPGDQYIANFGVLLAVSPETSLQFGQQLTFYGKDSFNGRAIPGSDRTNGLFTAGVLSVIGGRRVISMSLGIGETTDSPNIVVQVAMPMRLN